MANQIWVVIAGFIYLLFNKVRLATAGTEKRKRDYINHRYQRFREKYGTLVSSKTKDPALEALIYSVMIYENFNRPKIYRVVEGFLFRIGFAQTLGIMQVRSTSPIIDFESVSRGSDLIVKEYWAAFEVEDAESKRLYERIGSAGPELYKRSREPAAMRKALMIYNPSTAYVSEVAALTDIIRRTEYPKRVL